jgi:isopentenyl-diphosphate delta-isomerase
MTVDYILFATKDVTTDLNPNEVSDARYVSATELKEMFTDQGTSPSSLSFHLSPY